MLPVQLQEKSNHAWENFVKALAQVKAQDAVSPVNPPTPLTLWMPRDLRRFYRYSGSFTMPACDQVVVWTVFETPIHIGRRQLEHWNQLTTKFGPSKAGPSKLTNNFRPIQSRNGRRILFNQGHGFPRQFPSPRTVPVELKMQVVASEVPKISGGGLPGEYVLDQLRFHWGSTGDRGSEHTLYGARFPMEMHMVHHNAKFLGLTEAIASGEPTALAVLGFFFEVSEEPNNQWSNLVEALGHMDVQNAEHLVSPPTPLTLWMPEDLSGFYRYYGSLTTPTCDQVVVWTLFTSPIPIGREQIDLNSHERPHEKEDDKRLAKEKSFRHKNEKEKLEQWNKSKTKTDKQLTDNFRPTQPRNGREILCNFRECAKSSRIAIYIASTTGILAFIALVFYSSYRRLKRVSYARLS
ncbi:unnamed protein product [Darwinula stevensoni]|uniref:Carbonic anhydrase n=1 Tax=Darwinula stevensoni TaxID=69355 RepID=A0A7R9FR45_9CRUS|nr:unnamed protein product [Darwinula stevensoni]CAG0900313.1 unnamed protein product [Darwinula stevensoni]